MKGQRSIGLGGLVLALALGSGWLLPARAEEGTAPPATIRIGLAGSLFCDMPEPMVNACMGPFRVLMESQTGMRGDLVKGGDALALGGQLNSDKLHLAVFHGFEFAWAQQKYPKLRPLMIAVNQQPILYAHVLVRKDNSAASLADLKGQTLAMPSHTRPHCRLFLEKACHGCGRDMPGFFSRVTTPNNVEDALDDVVDGLVQTAVVDGVSLDCYRKRKPGRYAKLKEIQKSAAFPAAVVAYHAGAVDEATLRRFQKGMLNANKSAFGRQLLTLWKMTGFEPVPSDYDQCLTAISKLYPAPSKEKTDKKP
jgi:ABC-type phosphate/phosphonate transport system substrate-binding protein